MPLVNKLRVLRNRMKYSKQLEYELLSWKYVWFNLRTCDFFAREDRRMDDVMGKYLSSRAHGLKFDLSEEMQAKITENKSYATEQLARIYHRFMRAKEQDDLIFNIQNSIDAEERLSLKQKALSYLQHYNEALENVVEGQREVLRDKDFRFDDGQTAEQKETRLRDFISKFR